MTEPALMNPNSNPPIRKDAQLKVHVVDAQNLIRPDVYYVKMSQGDNQAETDRKGQTDEPTREPIWNEAIIFRIQDENDHLMIELFN